MLLKNESVKKREIKRNTFPQMKIEHTKHMECSKSKSKTEDCSNNYPPREIRKI